MPGTQQPIPWWLRQAFGMQEQYGIHRQSPAMARSPMVNDAATRMAADTPAQRYQFHSPSPSPTYAAPSVSVNAGGPDYAGFRGDQFFSGNRGPVVETPTTGADTAWENPPGFDVPPIRGEARTIPPRDPGRSPSPIEDLNDAWTGTEAQRRRAETNTPGPNLQTFGNNLTLGEYLNTPLADMRFGERYQGAIDTTQSVGTGQVQIDPSTGRPYDLANIPEATGDVQTTDYRDNATGNESTSTYPDIQQGTQSTDSGDPNAPDRTSSEPTTQSQQGGWPDAGPGAYNQYGSPGYGLTPLSAFSAFQMWANSLAQPVNSPGQGDSPRAGGFEDIGHLDSEGNYVRTGSVPRNYRSNLRSYTGFVYGSGAQGEASSRAGRSG